MADVKSLGRGGGAHVLETVRDFVPTSETGVVIRAVEEKSAQRSAASLTLAYCQPQIRTQKVCWVLQYGFVRMLSDGQAILSHNCHVRGADCYRGTVSGCLGSARGL